jgi:cytochrome c oxidase subunit IV
LPFITVTFMKKYWKNLAFLYSVCLWLMLSAAQMVLCYMVTDIQYADFNTQIRSHSARRRLLSP